MSRGRIEWLGTGSIMSNSVRCIAAALLLSAAFPASSQAQGRVGGTVAGSAVSSANAFVNRISGTCPSPAERIQLELQGRALIGELQALTQRSISYQQSNLTPSLVNASVAITDALNGLGRNCPTGTAGGWTGTYIGIHVGSGSGGQSWYERDGFFLGSGSMSGAFGGGQVGFNWQAGTIVFGVEGDASAAGISGDFSCFAPWRCDSDVKFLGSLRGRVGVATGNTGNVLIYGTGGAVWIYDKIHSVWPEIDTNFSGSQTRTGWIVGGGFELKLPQLGPDSNWSVKVEYTHSDFGTQSATLIPDTNRAGTWFVNVNQHVDTVKVGVNYRVGNFGSFFGQTRGF
jgi:outer membrane immunogenic protein